MVILYDTREQAPYLFNRPQYADAVVKQATLYTCDYTLEGFEDRVGIERKNLDDLTGTLTKGRDRFERECQRGRGLDLFALVIEASMEDVRVHRYQSRMDPHALLQTLFAYSVRYGLHVHWCCGRNGGEYAVYSILQKYLYEQTAQTKALIKKQLIPIEQLGIKRIMREGCENAGQAQG